MRRNLSTKFISLLPAGCLYLFWGAVGLLTIKTFQSYPGQGYIYLLFTVISNYLLYLGFRKKAIFFDAAMGTLLWLGFWLKVSVRIGLLEVGFIDSVSKFDGSSAVLDRGLLISSCGMAGLIVIALLRGNFFYYRDKTARKITQPALFSLYQENRKGVLAIFVLLVFGLAISNAYWGVYQRGQVPLTILPYGLGGIYKWLLQFGLASFGAVILHFEYVIGNKKSWIVAALVLLEGWASNISLLSRGMILNSTALFYGLFTSLKFDSVVKKIRFYGLVVVMFGALFVSSVFAVNYLRYSGEIMDVRSVSNVITSTAPLNTNNARIVSEQTKALFIDRWVGIEGVLAVAASQKEGWDLWRQAWREIYSEGSTSFYDLNIIHSPYLAVDTTVNHYVSLPGIIAFCFYPGSFPFLFGCMLLVGAIGAAVEIAVYKLGGQNLILCSLLAQVVAFRFTSFGYAPSQSYLLFGSLFLNLMIIYAAEQILSRIRRVFTAPSREIE